MRRLITVHLTIRILDGSVRCVDGVDASIDASAQRDETPKAARPEGVARFRRLAAFAAQRIVPQYDFRRKRSQTTKSLQSDAPLLTVASVAWKEMLAQESAIQDWCSVPKGHLIVACNFGTEHEVDRALLSLCPLPFTLKFQTCLLHFTRSR